MTATAASSVTGYSISGPQEAVFFFSALDTIAAKPQFILQGRRVVSVWSYFSYFDATEPL